MARRRIVVSTLGITAAVLATSGAAPGATKAADTTGAAPPTLVCKLPTGAGKLPATARRGLIAHLLQYPVVRLATRAQRTEAGRILDELVAAAARQGWRTPAAAERAGYDTRARTLAPGDPVGFFHAERPQEPRRGSIFDAARPKALIYANAPGRPLVLVGAMWSTRDGELGPTPAGAIMRWHSHVVCKKPGRRGLKPPASAKCPAGARLQQGTSEMLHVWFTNDLRSAFAISAPRPELCALGLIRTGCRS